MQVELLRVSLPTTIPGNNHNGSHTQSSALEETQRDHRANIYNYSNKGSNPMLDGIQFLNTYFFLSYVYIMVNSYSISLGDLKAISILINP